MRRIAAASVMAVLLMSACGPTPAGKVPAMTMEGGATIHAIAAPRGRSVVLVLSPADCISCDVDLS
jgi:hypothetical protein